MEGEKRERGEEEEGGTGDGRQGKREGSANLAAPPESAIATPVTQQHGKEGGT